MKRTFHPRAKLGDEIPKTLPLCWFVQPIPDKPGSQVYSRSSWCLAWTLGGGIRFPQLGVTADSWSLGKRIKGRLDLVSLVCRDCNERYELGYQTRGRGAPGLHCTKGINLAI